MMKDLTQFNLHSRSKRGDYAHNGLHKITNLIPYNYIDGSVVNIIIPEIQKIDHFYVTNFGLI